MNLKYGIVGALVLSLGMTARVDAVVIAEDDASDPAYADGWALGDNGGTGFLPWSGAGNYGGGPMDIDTGPDAMNNVGAPAFRTGNGFTGFQANRQFATPLQVGQSFSIDFDNFPIAPDGGQILISFGNEDGVNNDPDERISLYAYYYNDGTFTFGSDFWGVNAATANDNLAGGTTLPDDPLSGIIYRSTYTTTDSSDGFTLKLDVVTTDTYRLRVFDDNTTKLDVSGQMFANTAGQLINEMSIFGDVVTDFTFEQMVYFNNLKIESSGLAGDFDANGVITGRDFLAWQRNPNVGDLADWQNAYGSSGLGAFAAIPEPSAMGLSVIALLSCAGLSRRVKN